MTELQILKNAKACLELLAKGIDPLTKQPVPENDVVRKQGIIQYLNFVAEHLQKNIQKEQEKEKNTFVRFYISPERAASFQAENEPVTITKIAKKINEGFAPDENGFIPNAALSYWLESKGLLLRQLKEDGSFRRIASDKAVDYGITNIYAKNGNHKSVIYNTQAQQWILDSIEEISEFCIQNKDLFPQAEKFTPPAES